MGAPRGLHLKVQEAFLSGEPVVATELAEVLETTPQTINNFIRQMAHLVKKIGSTGQNGRGIRWSCVDMDGMRLWKPKAGVKAERNRREATAKDAKLALSDVWGIRHADIDLPTFRHAQEDEVEA